MSSLLTPLLMLVLIAGTALVVRRFYVRPGPGRALVAYRPTGVRVSFTGALVLPGLHRAALVDITTRRIDVARTGDRAVTSRDGKRLDIAASFFIGVEARADDVAKVANALGEQAASHDVVREMFEPKLNEALDVVAAQLTAEQLVHERVQVKERLVNVIGAELDGFRLHDVSVTTSRLLD